ncbi:YaaL family protein [Thermaerobacter subterraneus]|uniref:YaaL family protein n=1 Tax=Thermaerobacter subterraneus TaxID=175696 RepID=UPI0002EA7A71|nr:YaaL family protein [Thermaerobacter subterraneus]
MRAVEEARRDWEQARLYFECVTDRDLVDQAIHLVLAAEKRYAYLLKQARQRGIQGLPAHPGDPAGRKVAP